MTTTTTTRFEEQVRQQMIAIDIPAEQIIEVEQDAQRPERFTLVFDDTAHARAAVIQHLLSHCRQANTDTYFKPLRGGSQQGNRVQMAIKNLRAFLDDDGQDTWDDQWEIVADCSPKTDYSQIRVAPAAGYLNSYRGFTHLRQRRNVLSLGLEEPTMPTPTPSVDVPKMDCLRVHDHDLAVGDVVAYTRFSSTRYTLVEAQEDAGWFKVTDSDGHSMRRCFRNTNALFFVWGGPKLDAARQDASLVAKVPTGWNWIGGKFNPGTTRDMDTEVDLAPDTSESINQQEAPPVFDDLLNAIEDEIAVDKSAKPFLRIITQKGVELLSPAATTILEDEISELLIGGYSIQSVAMSVTCVVYTLINYDALALARKG